jgi:hypothetical protein
MESREKKTEFEPKIIVEHGKMTKTNQEMEDLF